jgi:hypothetical protein
VFERVLGLEHPHTLTTRNNLAYWTSNASDPSPTREATGAKPGANVLRPRPTQRDPLSAFAQVRMRSPRFSFAQTTAYPRRLLRDEEAAGSNPATPTYEVAVNSYIS